ncbi:MAG: hypothetical protein R3E54_07250 [Halioglobus sp.]
MDFRVSADEMLSYHGRGFVRGFDGRPYPPVPDRHTADNAAVIGSDAPPNLADTPLAIADGVDEAGGARRTEPP